jgi:hypothetical protein
MSVRVGMTGVARFDPFGLRVRSVSALGMSQTAAPSVPNPTAAALVRLLDESGGWVPLQGGLSAMHLPSLAAAAAALPVTDELYAAARRSKSPGNAMLGWLNRCGVARFNKQTSIGAAHYGDALFFHQRLQPGCAEAAGQLPFPAPKAERARTAQLAQVQLLGEPSPPAARPKRGRDESGEATDEDDGSEGSSSSPSSAPKRLRLTPPRPDASLEAALAAAGARVDRLLRWDRGVAALRDCADALAALVAEERAEVAAALATVRRGCAALELDLGR